MKPVYRQLALASAAMLLLGACNKEIRPAEEIRPVRFVIAGNTPADTRQLFSGEVRARQESQLAFRVGGKIIEKRVNSGERVHKGQVLAVLDATDYQLDSQAKAAALSSARAALAQQEADLKRYRELAAQSFVSQAQVDRQQAAVSSARATLEQAQAALSASHNQGSYTQLLAGSDGMISSLSAEPGMVVAAGQSVAVLAADGPREVQFQVPENALARVRHAHSFKVALWADGSERDAVLRELSGDADPATRTYTARLQLQGGDDGIRLGMTARITALGRPPADGAQAIRLPQTAILDENNKHYVWLIDPKSSKVGRKQVEIASLDNTSITLKSGLNGGEKVVTAGVHLLREGQRVSLLKE